MTGITVLGPVALEGEDSSLPPRDRVVLSALVSHRGRTVRTDSLVEALWGEHPPASAAKVVQGCIARLRRRLGASAIATERHGYRLTVPAEEIDAGRFERLVRRTRELLALDHADQAAYAADEALALWHGHPLAELEDWEPGRGEADRLTELRLQVEELRLEALLASGRHEEVLPEATFLVKEEPLREHRWALLARAQYQGARQASALATLRRAREVLAEELGLDPGRELVELEQAVLEQDPTLAVPPAGRSSSMCPWPGLASYDVDDADTFFGREVELAECLARLTHVRLLAIVGPSGSGKSSLARAGLAARLRHEGRGVQIISPGPRPLDELDGALDRRTAESVLVVDQSEEIFAPSVGEEVRSGFLARIVEQATRSPVVITLRADRLGELTAYPEVARLVEEGLYLLKGIGPESLREAIERPARRAGLLLEQGLVDLLVRDVEGAPGSLPLLAHALRETWERRQGSTLTVEGYRASGGIRGAVAQTAERVYQAVPAEQREALRELLLRMVQQGPGGEPVRASVERDTISTEPEHALLLEHLVRARLVTAEADRLEIAHEALARAWPRLQSWLAEDVEGERIRHHLTAAAAAWQEMGRPDSELYRGARLAAAREWRGDGTHRLTAVESAFLDASEAAHRSALARAQDEAVRQRRLNHRLRLLAVGAVVLALVAATFGVVARQQWQQGQQAQAVAASEAERATVEADRARAQELSAASMAAVGQDPALAKALAVLGAQAAPSSLQSKGALHRALAADRVVSRLSMNHDAGRLWAVLHPDATKVAMTAEHVYLPATAIEVHDAQTGDLVWEWVPPEEPGYGSVVVAGAQYSPDGQILAGGVLSDPWSTVRPGPRPQEAPRPPGGVLGVYLWDADTHELVDVVDVGPCGGWPVAIGGDRLLVRTLVAPPSQGLDAEQEASLFSECRWLDGAMGTLLVDRTTGKSHLVSVTEALNLHLTVGHALTDDGSFAVVPDFSTWSAVLVDGTTGRELGRVENAVAHDFDPSGERLLTVDAKGRGTDMWSVITVPDLRVDIVYTGRSSWSYYGRFAPDGQTVYTTGVENTLVQWDAGTGVHLRSLPAIGGGVPTGAATVDGRSLVLVPRPETAGAVLVDDSPPGELWSIPSCGGVAGKDRLRVTAERLVVGRDCNETPEGRLETFTLDGDPVDSWEGVSWEGLAVSPDGRLVVSRDGAGTGADGRPLVGPLRVRELDTGRETVELEGFCTHVAPNLLTGLDADEPTLERCAVFPETPFSFLIWTVAWSPDGQWIAAVSDVDGVGVWNARTGSLVARLSDLGSSTPDRFGPYDVRFTPDSRRLLVTTQERMVVAVDTATWDPGRERKLELQHAHSAGLVGFAADGSLVVVSPLFQVAASTALVLLDPETLEVRQVWRGVAHGAVQSADVSPDRTRVALATSEGVVTVWDLADRALIDQADPGLGSIDGLRWLDDQRLVLLSAKGHLTTVTTDADELLDLGRERLTRGLAQTECASYLIDPCPTLAELRDSGPVVPEELRGTYALTWTPGELEAAAVAWAERSFGDDLDEASLADLSDQAELLAGTYVVELGEAAYTITEEPLGEVVCTGAVSRSAADPDRLRLGADSGTRCVDFHYAEVGWHLAGDRLTFPSEQFRGRYLDKILWTGKTLEKVG